MKLFIFSFIFYLNKVCNYNWQKAFGNRTRPPMRRRNDRKTGSKMPRKMYLETTQGRCLREDGRYRQWEDFVKYLEEIIFSNFLKIANLIFFDLEYFFYFDYKKKGRLFRCALQLEKPYQYKILI